MLLNGIVPEHERPGTTLHDEPGDVKEVPGRTDGRRAARSGPPTPALDQAGFQGSGRSTRRRNQTVVPAPAVSWRAASPLTTATSIQPELPARATRVPG